VGDWSENASEEEIGAGLDVFLVAGRAKPARFAGEGEESVEAAVVTADASETAFEGAAVEELFDDLRDGGTQRSVAGLIVFRVTCEEGGKVAMGALPERRFARISGTIEFHGVPLCESWDHRPLTPPNRSRSRAFGQINNRAARDPCFEGVKESVLPQRVRGADWSRE